jgi:hypothetical protein
MQDYLSRRLEEQEFEECVEDLLNHFIVFLLGSQQVLKHLDEVGGCDVLANLVISANSGNQHHTLEDYVVFGVSIHEVVMKELD